MAAQQLACADAREAKPSLGNPFECFDHSSDPPAISRYFILAAAPIIVAFALGAAGLWIAAGFRKDQV